MKTLKDYEEMGCFNEDQLWQIRKGLEKGLDVSIYAKPEFVRDQMWQIRIGLEQGLDASYYAEPELNWGEMREIRICMNAVNGGAIDPGQLDLKRKGDTSESNTNHSSNGGNDDELHISKHMPRWLRLGLAYAVVWICSGLTFYFHLNGEYLWCYVFIVISLIYYRLTRED